MSNKKSAQVPETPKADRENIKKYFIFIIANGGKKVK